MVQLLSPLTQTPYPSATDNAVGDLFEVPDAVLQLEKFTVNRFTSVAARDAAIPVPVRGQSAVIGATAAASYFCFYDGAAWRTTSNIDSYLGADSGFPIGLVAITSEGVASRITIPARPFDRRLVASGSVYANYTQTADIDAILYMGASVIGRTRQRMTATVGENVSVTSTATSLAANVAGVVELRVVKNTGTGTISTSVGSGLTTLQVSIGPV